MKKIDNYATEMIPIRLIISITVIAAISFLIAIGVNNLLVTLSENQIEKEYLTVESKFYTMINSGVARELDIHSSENGTLRTHSFNLPDNLIYLGFGVDPEPYNNGNIITGLTEDGSAIFYRVNGGGKNVIWLNQKEIRFREGKFENNIWNINHDHQGFIITQGGKTILTFELVEKNLEKYILVHANDSIEI